MNKEESLDRQNTIENNMSSSAAVAQPPPNDGDDYSVYSQSVAAYHPYYPYPATMPPPQSQLIQHYPPSDAVYSAPHYHSNNHHAPLHAVYSVLPPPHPHHYHPAPPLPSQQQMYYGPWPSDASTVASTSSIGHQYYGAGLPPHTVQPQSYDQSVLPPPARGASDASLSSAANTSKAGDNDQQQQYHTHRTNPPVVWPIDNGPHSNDQFVMAIHSVKRNPKATLFDVKATGIAGIACYDESGSRFIHKRLRLGSSEEQDLAMEVATSSFQRLWMDTFGNYMLQGLFEFGTDEMKKELLELIHEEDVVNLCMHMNGCRVIQKAIRCLEPEQACRLIEKFHGKVMSFIYDPNGNHVIQRSIQVISTFSKLEAEHGNIDAATDMSDKMQFIIDDIVANTKALSAHRYGCRVVQRMIEYCTEVQKNVVLENIIDCHITLIMDQYGNYVIQQVLTHGEDSHVDAIIESLTTEDTLLTFSKHKYASNVLEAILERCKPVHKDVILKELLKDTRNEEGGYCCVLELSKDKIANYVVTKAIEVSENEIKDELFQVISSNREELSKSQYGKYVLQKFDKLNKNKSLPRNSSDILNYHK